MPHDPSGPAVPGQSADRLTDALREVAVQGRRSAPGPGSVVRRRAVLRRRVRRGGLVSAGLAVAATAVLAGTALLDPADRPAPPPAATASTTAPAPLPSDEDTAVRDISVDLNTLELHAGGRTFPVSAPGMNHPFRGDSVARVTGRHRHARFSASPTGVVEQHDWVLSFAGSRDDPHFVYGADGMTDVPGRRPSTLGLIGLRTADARWLYAHTTVGTKITITGDGT
ncbi:L,D-transpeptidase [Streptomyces actinomycinicus]|uniref:L,D-transpeptidase n=1 Tax=Streptomyces actinomycinicus TaxID=1695166 RepID=A0A937JP59_9ACTN|nr:L,D-transpeptidase [Streptomyces actinomycinicus]MBL1083127.1 L,D-transpeptidase [Streptomyces actinomycinicus]